MPLRMPLRAKLFSLCRDHAKPRLRTSLTAHASLGCLVLLRLGIACFLIGIELEPVFPSCISFIIVLQRRQ